jgi:hypothetical protein
MARWWHHGGVATATCPHGFAQGTCLICQTLGAQGNGPETTPWTTSRRGGAPSPVPVPAREVEVLRRRAGRAPLSVRLLGGAVVIAVAAVAVWWVVTLVWAVFHLLEIVAAAAAFGYGGWRLGVRHGRRHPG